jgi:hypothetical protein
MDASVHDRVHNWPEILVFHRSFVLVVTASVVAVLHGNILEVAFTSLVTDWAVQRVVSQ